MAFSRWMSRVIPTITKPPISSQLTTYINRCPIIELRYTFYLDPLPLALTDLSVGVLADTLAAVESQLQQPNN